MEVGKEDSNDVSSNSPENPENPFQPHLLLQQLFVKFFAVAGMVGDLHHLYLSLLVHSGFWLLITVLAVCQSILQNVYPQRILLEQNSSLACLCLLRNSCDD